MSIPISAGVGLEGRVVEQMMMGGLWEGLSRKENEWDEGSGDVGRTEEGLTSDGWMEGRGWCCMCGVKEYGR